MDFNNALSDIRAAIERDLDDNGIIYNAYLQQNNKVIYYTINCKRYLWYFYNELPSVSANVL